MGRLDDKVAIVTGGGRGIGRGICRRFAREGASVLVADISETVGQEVADSLEALGGLGVFQRADVTQKQSVRDMVARAKEEFGRIDVLVNCAIALTPHVALEDKTDEMFDFHMHIGLYATLWAMQEAFPIMRDQGGGRIINFYSSDADTGQWYHSDYSASKGAILGLTVSAAAEWGRYNILCNALCPSAATTVYETVLSKIPGFKERIAEYPLGRLGDPEEDIAPVALFLATEDSQYVNGQNLFVDGGAFLSRGGAYPLQPPSEVDEWMDARSRQ